MPYALDEGFGELDRRMHGADSAEATGYL